MQLFKTKRNYSRAIVLVVAIAALAGCKKGFLDRDPQGPIVLNENPATSNFRCFLPTSGSDHFNVSTGNTYRMPGTTLPTRFPFDVNHTNMTNGNPAGFVPDWEVVPTWSTPPGK